MAIRVETLKRFVSALDGMIASMGQQQILYGLSPKEREALDKLKDARLRMVEELDVAQPGWKLPWQEGRA